MGASQIGQFQLNQKLPACLGPALGTFTIASFIIAWQDPFTSFLAFPAVTASTAPSSIVDRPCPMVKPSILTVAFAMRPYLGVFHRVLPFVALQVVQLVLAIEQLLHRHQRQRHRYLRRLHRLMEALDLLGRQSYLEFLFALIFKFKILETE